MLRPPTAVLVRTESLMQGNGNQRKGAQVLLSKPLPVRFKARFVFTYNNLATQRLIHTT
jgi:hypothetical protein